MFNRNACNLLLFCKEIEIWVKLTNGYDKSKAENSRFFKMNIDKGFLEG